MEQPPVATCVLLAARLDWLEAVLPLLFLLFWIVSQAVAAVRRLGNGRRPARPLPRLEPQGQPRPMPIPGGGDAADPRAELDRQIAEFLRESLGGTRQPSGGAGQADELVKLLRNPVTVRQIVLLREILDRPTDRW